MAPNTGNVLDSCHCSASGGGCRTGDVGRGVVTVVMDVSEADASTIKSLMSGTYIHYNQESSLSGAYTTQSA